MADERSDTLLTLTADIVAAHVANNSVPVADLAGLIAQVHGALGRLGAVETAAEVQQQPAVSVRASVKPDHIVCLEDGKKLKMLKRYIGSKFGFTPQDYRAKWNLPPDYPMVAPNYAEARRTLARSIGLGRKKAGAAISPTPLAGNEMASAPAATQGAERPARKPRVSKANGSAEPVSAAKAPRRRLTVVHPE